MNSLRAKAIDPKQYDNPDMDWLSEGGQDTPTRIFLKEILDSYLGDLSGKTMLDVGCGTGWLSEIAFAHKASSYTGVDPSRRNIKAAQSLYPKATFINKVFEDFQSEDQYNLITCILSTEHIDDIQNTFHKWYEKLLPKGRLLIVTDDLKAFTRERFGYILTIEKLSEDEAVVETIRPNSVNIVDIVRSKDVFLKAAKSSGFSLEKTTPLTANRRFIELMPRYSIFKDDPVYQLLIFKKSEAGKNWGKP